MDASTVPLQLLVGRGFVPVPGPESPIASGKPDGGGGGGGEDKGLLCEKEGGHNNRQLCKKRLVCGEEEYEYGSGVKGRGG